MNKEEISIEVGVQHKYGFCAFNRECHYVQIDTTKSPNQRLKKIILCSGNKTYPLPGNMTFNPIWKMRRGCWSFYLQNMTFIPRFWLFIRWPYQPRSCNYACKLQAYWPFFPFEEKNLLKPRDCFSGVGAEEEEELDLVGLCFGCFEPIGDLKRRLDSVSDGLRGELYISKGDSPPILCTFIEAVLSMSAWS